MIFAPLLAPVVGWFGSAFGAVVAWFVTKRGIITVSMFSFIGLIGAAATTLLSDINSSIGSLIQLPAFASFFVPANLTGCITAIVSAHALCTTYSLVIKFYTLKIKTLVAD